MQVRRCTNALVPIPRGPKPYRQTAIRLSPRDDAAIRRIIAAGFAQNQTDAIKVALQRFAEWAEKAA